VKNFALVNDAVDW